MFVVVYIVKILYVMCSYDLFHTLLLSLWHTAGCMELCVCEYTGCPRRNVQYFGRVFLMLNYTDIIQNTYIQSW